MLKPKNRVHVSDNTYKCSIAWKWRPHLIVDPFKKLKSFPQRNWSTILIVDCRNIKIAENDWRKIKELYFLIWCFHLKLSSKEENSRTYCFLASE